MFNSTCFVRTCLLALTCVMVMSHAAPAAEADQKAVGPGRAVRFVDRNGIMTLMGPGIHPRIVISRTATESEKYAAEELQTYLRKITPEPCSIETDNDPAAGTLRSPLIVLGYHPLNADLNPDDLALEESIVSVEQHRIRIVGGKEPSVTSPDGKTHVRDRGTLYGVYHLLDELGVRWYRPDPWGEHVPKMESVQLPMGDRFYKPGYKYRDSTGIYRWFKDQTPEQAEMARMWAVRNLLNTNISANEPKHGGVYYFRSHHNYPNLLGVGKYYKEHPEYFALVNGERSKWGQLCLSNPEVQEILAQAAIEEARKYPQAETVSLSPTDGTLWCECEGCRAMDDPELIAPNGGEERLGKVSMSNRVTVVHNMIAKRVSEAVPGKKVAWYAYLATSEVPTRITELEPNIVIMPTSMAAAYGDYSALLNDPNSRGNRRFLGILQGWSRMAPMVTREYWSGGCWYGPIPMLTVLKDRLTEYRKYRVEGVINESHPSWGPQTDLHYFLARLMWNPDLDLDAELEEFCRNYYGPAADPMLRYHRLLEKASLEGPPWFFLGRLITRLYDNDELIAQMGVLIKEAQELAADKEPFNRAVEGAWAGYEVARLYNKAANLKREKKIDEAKEVWKQLGQFITSDPGGIFDAGPVMFRVHWQTMSQQVGLPSEITWQ